MSALHCSLGDAGKHQVAMRLQQCSEPAALIDTGEEVSPSEWEGEGPAYRDDRDA